MSRCGTSVRPRQVAAPRHLIAERPHPHRDLKRGRLTLMAVGVALVGCAALAAQSRGPRVLDAADPIGTFVAEGDTRAHYTPADRQLAEWALAAWQRAAAPGLKLTPAPEASARVRLYWAGPLSGQYGEMRALRVGDQMGAAVYIRPDTASLGADIHALASSDPLFRDAVVYLTCLHELGHAFGLDHTAEFDDIMYSFQFGGDLVEYFGRFRRGLRVRDDIKHSSGLSAADVATVRALYPPRR